MAASVLPTNYGDQLTVTPSLKNSQNFSTQQTTELNPVSTEVGGKFPMQTGEVTFLFRRKTFLGGKKTPSLKLASTLRS